MIKHKVLLTLCLNLLIGLPVITRAHALTINVASCSESDVKTAIGSAADGDVVQIPSGECTWNAVVNIDLVSGGGKGISIVGAGMDKTVITNMGFSVVGADGKNFRLSGMTLKGNAGIAVRGESKTWRIDNVRFDKSTGAAHCAGRVIWVQASGTAAAYTAGVIDSCVFDNPGAIQIHVRGNNSSGGNETWARALNLGSSDAVYIEDCIFNLSSWNPSTPTTDCEGGNFVFRHNKATNVYLEMHDAIVTNYRGCRKWEIYENEFINIDTQAYWGLHLRSGTGVVFNNTWNGKPGGDPIAITLYRTYQKGGDPWDALCSNTSGKACLGTDRSYPKECSTDADCGGLSGSCVNVDGITSNGYPCRDQIGQAGNKVQETVPALFWNNKYCDKYPCTPASFASVHKVSGGDYYTENRDFCIGTADMPTTCSGKPVIYAPYTYPHPLRGIEDGLSAPKNLRIN